MAQFETWLNSDLQKPLQVQYLKGNIFSADNEGNKVGVRVFSDGESVTLAGTVSGNVIRADGATVAVEGAFSGNEAYIILPQAAYAVPGVASIIIKITNSGAVTTLGACVVTIYESTTSTVVDPGTIIPDIGALIAEIEAAVASIPADYSALWTSLAPAFSSSTVYMDGQYVTYNGSVYRFKTSHSGSWSASDVQAVTLGGEAGNMMNMLKKYTRTVTTFIPGCYVAATASGGIIGNIYNASDYCITGLLAVPDEIETTFVQNSGAGLVFYDFNLNVVKATTDYTHIDIPYNAAYFRITDYDPLHNFNREVKLIYHKLSYERIMANSALSSSNLISLLYVADIENAFIDFSDGVQKSNTNYKCSDYIPVTKDSIICLESYSYSAAAGIAFYTEDKTYITGYGNSSYTIPTNAHYMRFSVHKEFTGKCHVFFNQCLRMGNELEITATFQGYIDYSLNGAFFYHAKYKCTDYIPIPDIITTTCNQGGTDACLAFYDENKTFVSATKNYNNIVIPASACYFRVSDYDENNEQTGIVVCKYVGSKNNNYQTRDNPLYGKKLVFVGDSLTAVYYKTTEESWPVLIAERNNATPVNLGISGNPVAEVSGYTEALPMCDRLDTIPADADYIMLMGGANDFNFSVPIGENSDTVKTTFKGALNYSIDYLITHFPRAKLLFATTYRRNEARNDEVYATAMIDICRLWSVPCLDTYHGSGVHFFNEAWMTIHGAWTWSGDESQKMTNRHLNAVGDAFVSTLFEAALKSI